MVSRLPDRLAQTFDAVFTETRTDAFERLIIGLAALGFIVHLGLILVARSLSAPPPLLASLNANYLSALYTPFSFILFYEVLLLILSISKSTTQSLGRQYEIISLIVIRNVFKDIAAFDSFKIIQEQFGDFVNVLVDMGGGLLMFLMVAVFYHIRRRHQMTIAPEKDLSPELRTFITRKKAVALALSVLLFVLAAYNLVLWSVDVYRVAYAGTAPTIDVRNIFYVDLFTVMIFTDVLILLFSMLRSDAYQLVFRNAGFIVSTILIRFSLTLDKPYDVELAILAMLFGILVLLVYHYFCRISDPTEKKSRHQGTVSANGAVSNTINDPAETT